MYAINTKIHAMLPPCSFSSFSALDKIMDVTSQYVNSPQKQLLLLPN